MIPTGKSKRKGVLPLLKNVCRGGGGGREEINAGCLPEKFLHPTWNILTKKGRGWDLFRSF
jgi:hypothetical protein